MDDKQMLPGIIMALIAKNTMITESLMWEYLKEFSKTDVSEALEYLGKKDLVYYYKFEPFDHTLKFEPYYTIRS